MKSRQEKQEKTYANIHTRKYCNSKEKDFSLNQNSGVFKRKSKNFINKNELSSKKFNITFNVSNNEVSSERKLDDKDQNLIINQMSEKISKLSYCSYNSNSKDLIIFIFYNKFDYIYFLFYFKDDEKNLCIDEENKTNELNNTNKELYNKNFRVI